ncbi:MAG TPA: hypothetical protein VI997_05585, partial [Candidatus Thermoplasmatota archaeon]|nr:hypothetical protein [Candidatus Thermoplasmatota archaeon]
EPVASEGTSVLEIGGPRTAIDKFGVSRETVLVRRDEGTRRGECDLLQGGIEEVRMEFDPMSDPFVWRQTVAGVPLLDHTIEVGVMFRANCDVPVDLGGRSLRTGDSIEAPWIFSSFRWRQLGWDYLRGRTDASLPAVSTTFEGRPALDFSWDIVPRAVGAAAPTGRITITLAHGLPGVVASSFERLDEDGTTLRRSDALVGYEAGAGVELRDEGARLPRHDPAAAPVPVDPLGFDDGAWGFGYGASEALAAIRADPALDLDAYLDGHPEAILLQAWHFRPNTALSPATTEERWWFAFADEGSGRWYSSTRYAPVVGALPAMSEGGEIDERAPPDARSRLPGLVAPSSVLAGASERGGVPPDRAGIVGFWLADAGGALDVYVEVFDNITASAPKKVREAAIQPQKWVSLDGVGGGMRIAAARTDADFAPVVAPPGLAPSMPAAEERARIVWAPATVAGGVALAALLALGGRVLLAPLYTRLVRSSLLRQEARAALYERIRREPGIHQAALVGGSGLADGAARHHLGTLVSHRLVFVVGDGRHVRYFVSGDVPAHEARRLGLLRSGSLREVFDLYAAEPAVTLRAAARRLGMSAPSVYRAKRRLEREGLLPAPDGLVAVRKA